MDLVLKMKIPLQRIKVERFSIKGETVWTVGVISQTIQCVRQGKISGNIHIQAKVVRDLYSLYDVDCIASVKTYGRLVGKEPSKPPDDNIMDLDDDEECIIHDDDDGEDEIVPADDGKDNTIRADEGEDNIEKAAKDKDENIIAIDEDLEEIADAPWNWGCQPVPTVDELYPDEDPEDNARWYQELHQPSPRSPPRKNIGKIKRKSTSNISTEDEKFCQLCYYEGEPVSVVMSHPNLDITCPTMTDQEKETMFGPNWMARMHGYPD